jgi:ATP-dependent Zn protease
VSDFQQTLNKYLTRAFVAIIALVAVLAFFFNAANPPRQPSGTISISQVLADAQKGKIARIEIQHADPHDLFITYKDQPDRLWYARVETNQSIVILLTTARVALDTLTIEVAPPPVWGDSPLDTMKILLPPLVFVGIFVLIGRARRAQEQQRAAPK